MLKSMTGYGRGEAVTDAFVYTVEVQALNHRFMEVRVKLPRTLVPLELVLQQLVQAACQRGRFDVLVVERPTEKGVRALRVDRVSAEQVVAALKELQLSLELGGEVTLEILMGFRELIALEAPAVDLVEAEGAIRKALLLALEGLEGMRIKEGEALGGALLRHLDRIEVHLAAMEARAPEVIEGFRRRLTEQVRSLLGGVPVDAGRLEQEVVLLAERADIAEEITRLKSHIDQFRGMLSASGPHGRRLDFLLQEMVREVNTVGSKASDAQVSQAVVEVKAGLERLREQVQNVE